MSIETLPEQITDDVLDHLLNSPQPCEWGTFKDRHLLINGREIVSDFEDCPETATQFFEMTSNDPAPHPILVGLCAQHAKELDGAG